MNSDDRFWLFMYHGAYTRIGKDDIDNWNIYMWEDPMEMKAVVYLKRHAEDSRPHMTVTGEAPLTLRLWGWKGWDWYRAGARALRALG